MTKIVVKGKKRKLKSKIRKAICTTMSAIFMASAILVAAIPVDNIEAVSGSGVTLDSIGTNIPVIPTTGDGYSNARIYTTGDDMFQFAYVDRPSGSDKIAVIVGYKGGTLPGGVLTIPDKVDGYKNTELGLVAVSADGSTLYFPVYQNKETPTGNYITKDVLDENGNVVGTVSENEVKVESVLVGYEPCYYNDTYRQQWIDMPVDELCYKITETIEDNTVLTNFQQCRTDDKKWINGAEVTYIANQHLQYETIDEETKWRLVNSTDAGVFSQNGGNIVKLVTGDYLLGIGDYAFYGCANLNGISLSNGANTIGKYAFADCHNLVNADIDLHAAISVIGDYAFKNCDGLQSFTLPISVKDICDGAFQGCTSLMSIALCSDDYNTSLQNIGKEVFKGCSSLRELVFPRSFTQNNNDLDLTLVQGCTNLRSITIQNNSLNFVDTPGSYTFDDFKRSVGDEFYFAGYSTSNIHNTSTENSIAFKYLDSPYLYEKVLQEKDDDGLEIAGENHRMTYRVDENNNLQEFEMGNAVQNVEIPGSVGPYKILKIGTDSFRNMCRLKKITIPSSITTIEDNAFQGCHNLEAIIFEEPINLTTIGSGAFDTQVVETGKNCEVASGKCVEQLPVQPFLSFTGTIDPNSVPFQYAMNPENNINRGTQKRTYITFFSGWPTNLTVQYNPLTGLNELVDYPTYTELKTGALVPEDTEQHGDSYPYLTAEQENAARDAVMAYEAYLSGGPQPTQDQMEVVNTALNVVIPKGVDGIKEGIFSGKDVSGNSIGTSDDTLQGIKMEGVSNVPAYAFYGCKGLQSVAMYASDEENGDYVGNYAFGDCDELTNVSMSANVRQFGLRPFKECEKLTDVSFNDSPYFVCDKGIIYGLRDGKKVSIVECLETRGSTGEYTVGASMVAKSELEDVETIQDEAFKGCLGIGDVNLSTSKVEEIPVSCFEDTSYLFSVEIPETTRTIREYAFKNSAVRSLTIPDSVSYIDSSAFTNKNGGVNKNITISCSEGSAAETFANLYGLTLGEPIVKTFNVIFFDWDDTILSSQQVAMGEDAVAPAAPVRKGYTFLGWKPDYTNIARDMSVYAYYDRTLEDLDSIKHTVTFYDWDDSIVSQQTVYDGEDAITPPAPVREGYLFTGWRQSYTNVTKDIDVYAEYEKAGEAGTGTGEGDGAGTGTGTNTSGTYTVTFYNYDQAIVSQQKVEAGGTPTTPISPTREGYQFVGWLPSYENITKDLDVFAQYEKKATSGTSTSVSDSATDTDGSDSGSKGETYVVTVENGSGSGSYTPGSTVTIAANDIAGRTFSNWATESKDFMISDVTAKKATFVMPNHAVNIVAKYTTVSSTTNKIYSTSASGNTIVKKPLTNGGTIVDITKSGISNRDVASASVSGSSDNFVVKITEDENARVQVEQALLAEYGTLENIKYFAMDISLYDKTGKNKITNTDGLSVTITMPIPDALRDYAGNNKAASIVNSRLEKLEPRFTTIDGVPCVSFVAKHFSPYTIYVDTANLTVGINQDSTPTTGDPIHPKWFLVIGLALLSVLMFGAGGRKQKVIVNV